MILDEQSSSYQGLFGWIGDNVVENLSVSGSIIGMSYTGGIVGHAYMTTIKNCHNSADISGGGYIGGVVGNLRYSTITGSSNAGTISSTGNRVGGVAGQLQGESSDYSVYSVMTNCYNLGDVVTTGYSVGGLAGDVIAAKMENCYNTGAITGLYDVGGVGGITRLGSHVNYCYNTGSIVHTSIEVNRYSGGITGSVMSDAVLENCFSTGKLQGQVGYIKGTHGIATGSVKNCYYDNEVAEVNTAGALTTNQMLGATALDHMIFSYDGEVTDLDIWVLTQQTDDEGYTANYYPQLKVFADSSNSKIKADSLKSVEVSDKVNVKALEVEGMDDVIFNGLQQVPVYKILDGDTELIEGVDYTVVYSSNIDKGTVTVEITGMDRYAGKRTVTFEILPKDISELDVADISSLTYDATEREPKLTITYGLVVLIEGTDYTVTYSNNSNAGTATVAIKGIGNYTGTDEKHFTINKAAGIASVSIADWMYAEEESTPISASSTNGTTNVTYEYKLRGASDDTYVSGLPINAGEYTLRATFAEANNHLESTATDDFEILKADGSGTVTMEGWTYSGIETNSPNALSIVHEGIGVAWYCDSENGTYSTVPFINAGTYWVKFIFAESGNYNAFETDAFDYTIEKAQLTITATDQFMINGNDSNVTINDATYSGFVNEEGESVLGGTLIFTYGDGSPLITLGNGTYDIKISGLTSSNYDIDYEDGTLTVSDKLITHITAEDVITKYDGSSKAVTGQLDAEGVLTYLYVGINDTIYSSTADAPSDAGTYKVTISYAGNSTQEACTLEVNLTITKADPTFTQGESYEYTYGQALSVNTLTEAASVPGAFVWVNPTYKPTVATISVKAKFTPTDTDNYNTVEFDVTISVDKADPTFTQAGSYEYTYGQALSVNTLTESNVVDGIFVWLNPTYKHTVATTSVKTKFTPTDTDNYNTVEFDVTISVDKADPTFTQAGSYEYTYGQALSEQTLTETASVPGTFAWLNPTNIPTVATTSVKAKFTPTDEANYNTVEFDVTISVSTPVYEVTDGGDGTVKLNEEGYTITINGDFAKFSKLEVNGVELIKDTDYTVSEGSTIITINKTGLVKLGEGEHTVKAYFSDGGIVSTSLNIDKADGNGGIDGGLIVALVIVGIVVAAVGGFAVFWFGIKKKKFNDLKTIFVRK